jgi:hypothetical protein
MCEFKPKQSTYESQESEELSVDCLNSIFRESVKVKSDFSTNDKTANVDGNIELLKDRRIVGKIVVQIKTLPKCDYSNPKFKCPTSLLGYAKECANEIVFLVVVNNADCIAYWKYIDATLIDSHKSKVNQQTITLKFSDAEKLDKQNIHEVIEVWNKIFVKKKNLIIDSERNEKENLKLNEVINNYQNPVLDFDRESIIKLQSFIDTFNYLLDNEYSFIKETYFSNAWKMGIAIFEFNPSEVSFIIYRIDNGNNGLLIRQLPIAEFIKIEEFSPFSMRSCVSNPIYVNPTQYALDLVFEKVISVFSEKNLVFLTYETAIEYVFDFIDKNYNILNLTKEADCYDLNSLKSELVNSYPRINKNGQYLLRTGNSNINIKPLYEAIVFLETKALSKITRLYPGKENYGNTGLIFDLYSPESAFLKVKYFYDRLPQLVDSFIDTLFPLFKNKISLFGESDLILVNINYEEGANKQRSFNHSISVFYLKKKGLHKNKKEIISSLNYNLKVYHDNEIDSYESFLST